MFIFFFIILAVYQLFTNCGIVWCTAVYILVCGYSFQNA